MLVFLAALIVNFLLVFKEDDQVAIIIEGGFALKALLKVRIKSQKGTWVRKTLRISNIRPVIGFVDCNPKFSQENIHIVLLSYDGLMNAFLK